MFLKILVRFFLIFTIIVSYSFAQEEISAPTEGTPTQQVKLTDEEILVLLREKYQGTAMEGFVNGNPRLMELIVKVMRNEEITKLWKETLKDKTQYYIFSGFFILTLLINWWWKRRQIQTLAPFHQKLFAWLMRFTIINGSRVGAFVFLFKKEITPVWELFKKTFGY